MLANAQDVDTLAKVEKARSEVPACQKLLVKSRSTGGMALHFPVRRLGASGDCPESAQRSNEAFA